MAVCLLEDTATRAVRRKKKPAARNGPRGRLPGRGGILGALDNWKEVV